VAAVLIAAGPDVALTASVVPACDGKDGRPAHDLTKWHSLVVRKSNGSILCSYGHEHGADPSVLDDVFGELGDHIGQEISYPWRTVKENSDATLAVKTVSRRQIDGGKHRFYKWEVITAQELTDAGRLPCASSFASLSFDNIRMEVHADGNAGATIRFHSFYVEAETCDPKNPSYHGIVKIGGQFDYGRLRGLENTPRGPEDTLIPLPGVDPPNTYVNNGSRTHGTSSGSCQGCSGAARDDFTWYGANASREFQTSPVQIGVSDGIREQDWGPVNPNNPGGPVQFYSPGWLGEPNHDHGWASQVDILGIGIPRGSILPGARSRAGGTYDWNGHVDRHGNVVTCGRVGVDCIPVTLANVKPGSYQFSQDDPLRGMPPENFDVTGPGGATLMRYPN
jgi:hypothetical protein